MKGLLILFLVLAFMPAQISNKPDKNGPKTTLNFLPILEFIWQKLVGKYHDAERSKLLANLSLMLFYGIAVSVLLKERSSLLVTHKHTSGKEVANLNILEEIQDFGVKTKLEKAISLFPSFNYYGDLSRSQSSVWVCPAHIEYYFKEAQSSNDNNTLMKYEWARYASFKTFPQDSPAMPSSLAKAGFYFIGPNDAVQCFSCSLVYSGWKYGDSPLATHRRFSPGCNFWTESIAIHESSCASNTSSTGDVCNDTACNETRTEDSGSAAECQSSVVINVDVNCKHPQYKDFAVRLSSFTKWNCRDVQEPRDLAEAGYFYAGFGDCVRCYCCGIGLRNWEYGDGPWEEHARWSADCLYLKKNKSAEFIQKYREGDDEAQDSTGACGDIKPNLKETVHEKSALKANESKSTDEITSQLLKMGFEQSIIADAVLAYNKEKNDTVPTCSDLVDIILQFDTKRERGLSTLASKPDPQSKPKESTSVGSVGHACKTQEKLSISRYDPGLSIDCLQGENRQLKERLICKICMDRDACMVLLPCGHLISCETCAPALRNCAVCRARVKERIKTYLS